MGDKRAFANFDVGYMQNPKLVAMPFAMPTALLAHMQSILYCAQHLTDGHAPEHLVRSLTNASQEDADHLVNIGLWHRSGHDCDECPDPTDLHIYVHDYLEHNRPKSDVIKKSEIAKRNAEARWNADSNATGNATGNANRNASGNAKKERKKDTPPTPSDEAQQAFDKWWARYPKKIDKGQALKTFRAKIKSVDLDTLIATADRYAEQVKREGTEPRFIKNPSTWLNAEPWHDEPPPQSPAAKSVWDYTEEDYIRAEEKLERRHAAGGNPF